MSQKGASQRGAKKVGILTSGGDCPGLNAAIRGICRAGQDRFGMQFVGFREGFRGLVHDRSQELHSRDLSGILTDGETILGTSRDKPHKMPVGEKTRDLTDVAVETYKRHRLDALVCLGGGGTQKNALHLKQAGLDVVTLPKTIDNDVALTDVSFGFDTAVNIAAESIEQGVTGVMFAAAGETVAPVPLEEVAGKKKLVPPDHPWVTAARQVGTCIGD